MSKYHAQNSFTPHKRQGKSTAFTARTAAAAEESAHLTAVSTRILFSCPYQTGVSERKVSQIFIKNAKTISFFCGIVYAYFNLASKIRKGVDPRGDFFIVGTEAEKRNRTEIGA